MSVSPTTLEVIVRSPIGVIRAWVAEDGTIRTSISCEFGAEEAQAGSPEAMAAVLAQAAAAIRGLNTRAGASGFTPAFADWLAERCEIDTAGRELASALYDDFTAWRRSRGLTATISMAAFGAACGDRGLALAGKNARGQKYRGGVRLRAVTAPRLALAAEA